MNENRKPKQIVYGNFKGGTGKTNVLFNTGAMLAKDKTNEKGEVIEKGAKVLMIDLDPQSNLTSYFNISASSDYSNSDPDNLYGANILNIFDTNRIQMDIDVLGRQLTLEEIVRKDNFDELPNLHILPGHMDLNFVARALLLFNPGEEGMNRTNRILYDFLHSEANEDFYNSYDYVLIDTNPYVDLLAINGMYGGATTVVVSDVGTYSLRGIDMFNKCQSVYLNLDMNEIHYSGIILNKAEPHTISTQNALELAEYKYGDKLFKTYLRKTTKVNDAEQMHLPICLCYPENTPINKQFAQLIAEMKMKGVL